MTAVPLIDAIIETQLGQRRMREHRELQRHNDDNPRENPDADNDRYPR